MTWRKRCFLVLSIAINTVFVRGGVEPETLINSANTSGEQVLREKMQWYLEQVDRQISTLDSFLHKYYDNFNYTEEDVAEYVSNPINTYMMIKRTAVEWPKVREVVFNKTLDSELEEIIELKQSLQ